MVYSISRGRKNKSQHQFHKNELNQAEIEKIIEDVERNTNSIFDSTIIKNCLVKEFERTGRKTPFFATFINKFDSIVEEPWTISNYIQHSTNEVFKYATEKHDKSVEQELNHFEIESRDFIKRYSRGQLDLSDISKLLKSFDDRYSSFHNVRADVITSIDEARHEVSKTLLKLGTMDLERELDDLLAEYQEVEQITEEEMGNEEHSQIDVNIMTQTQQHSPIIGKRTPVDMIPTMLEEMKLGEDCYLCATPVDENDDISIPNKNTVKKALVSNTKNLEAIAIDLALSDDIEDRISDSLDEFQKSKETAMKIPQQFNNTIQISNQEKLMLPRIGDGKKKLKTGFL